MTGVLSSLGDGIDGFIKDMMTIGQDLEQNIGRSQTELDNPEDGSTSSVTPTTNSSTQTVNPVTPVTPNTNVQDTSSLNQTTTQGVLNGDVNLNVGGTIDFTIDGRNLPQNISTEELASQIVNNPDFTSKLMSIFTDSNNTYSV